VGAVAGPATLPGAGAMNVGAGTADRRFARRTSRPTTTMALNSTTTTTMNTMSTACPPPTGVGGTSAKNLGNGTTKG